MRKAISIDYGEKRIGLAISDKNLRFAKPLKVVINKDKISTINQIRDIIKENEIDTIVIGQPLDIKGNDTVMAEQIRQFTKELLEGLNDLKVIYWDESFSSYEAYENLVNKNGTRPKIKGLVDLESARIILQEFLDHNAGL